MSTDPKELEKRVILLRNSNILTDRTLESYYGAKRFEQVAESNEMIKCIQFHWIKVNGC